MITSLIEMLELPNFGHITTKVKRESRDKIFLVTPQTEILQNTYFLRRTRVANFSDIIKIATKFIKTTCNDSKKVKIIRNYVLKCNLILLKTSLIVPDKLNY